MITRPFVTEHPEQLLKRYRRHVNDCKPCTYADMFVAGCSIGHTMYREYETSKEDLIKERAES